MIIDKPLETFLRFGGADIGEVSELNIACIH